MFEKRAENFTFFFPLILHHLTEKYGSETGSSIEQKGPAVLPGPAAHARPQGLHEEGGVGGGREEDDDLFEREVHDHDGSTAHLHQRAQNVQAAEGQERRVAGEDHQRGAALLRLHEEPAGGPAHLRPVHRAVQGLGRLPQDFAAHLRQPRQKRPQVKIRPDPVEEGVGPAAGHHQGGVGARQAARPEAEQPGVQEAVQGHRQRAARGHKLRPERFESHTEAQAVPEDVEAVHGVGRAEEAVRIPRRQAAPGAAGREQQEGGRVAGAGPEAGQGAAGRRAHVPQTRAEEHERRAPAGQDGQHAEGPDGEPAEAPVRVRQVQGYARPEQHAHQVPQGVRQGAAPVSPHARALRAVQGGQVRARRDIPRAPQRQGSQQNPGSEKGTEEVHAVEGEGNRAGGKHRRPVEGGPQQGRLQEDGGRGSGRPVHQFPPQAEKGGEEGRVSGGAQEMSQ